MSKVHAYFIRRRDVSTPLGYVGTWDTFISCSLVIIVATITTMMRMRATMTLDNDNDGDDNGATRVYRENKFDNKIF